MIDPALKTLTNLRAEREVARQKALSSLAVYKFQMFGYWAAIWVHLNRLCPDRQKNPFRDVVKLSREMLRADGHDQGGLYSANVLRLSRQSSLPAPPVPDQEGR